MSTSNQQFPAAYIITRDSYSAVVECPYCGEQHQHETTGINTAVCGAGQYTVIARM